MNINSVEKPEQDLSNGLTKPIFNVHSIFFYRYKEWRIHLNHLVKDEKCRDAKEHLKVVGSRNRLRSDEATVGNRVANVPFFCFNLCK
jgi:hypothetical protein